MPTIDEVFSSDETLKAHHLPQGLAVPVVIESVKPRQFDDGAKLELRFRGKRRPLLANKTNSTTIAKYLRERDYSKWPGRTIFLVRATTEFKGDQVECVRVSLDPPAQPAARRVEPQSTSAPGETNF